MKDIHFVAFCKLLGLPYAEPYFEPVTELGSWHSEDSGPLLTISGKMIAFAPVLRTRKTMNLGSATLHGHCVSRMLML